MTTRLTQHRLMPLWLALALTASLLAIAGPAQAATVAYDCAAPPPNYPTLQSLISGDPAAMPPLAPGVASGDTISLSGTCTEDISMVYPLNIEAAVPTAAITGTGGASVITVGVGANPVLLKGITISGGGSTTGAGINNAGNLTLDGVSLTGNAATEGSGGGVLNGSTGRLTVLAGTSIANNTADFGGGIQNLGTLTISGGSFTNNGALAGGAVNNGGTATISAGLFDSNTANEGAGIFNGAALTMNGGTVSNNDAVDNGGGIYVANSATTTSLSLVTISNNTAKDGAGLYNNDTTTLNSPTFTGNRATDDPSGTAETIGTGGAISDHGTLAISGNTIIDSNSAVGAGGGIYIPGGNTTIAAAIITNNSAPAGGGIQLDGGTLNVTSGATISANTASDSGGGISAANSTVTLGSVSVDSNSAANNGGGVFLFASSLTANGTTFDSNTGVAEAGGIFVDPTSSADIDNTVFTTNGAGTSGVEPSDGGALHNLGTSSVDLSTFTANTTEDGVGGAIYNAGFLTVGTSTFTSNSVATVSTLVAGGAIYNIGDLTIDSSTFSANSAPSFGGGAIYNIANGGAPSETGQATITNSTITGNSGPSGGGIANNNGADITIINSTITENNASTSGGGIWSDDGTGSTVTMTGTILADNTSVFTLECNGVIDSGGYNIVGNEPFSGFCTFNAATGDQVGTSGSPIDPMLLALADNGGPTFTQLPDTGSPAINKIPVAVCPSSEDQRGTGRPLEGACEIGSVEIGVDSPPVAVNDNAVVAGLGGSKVIAVTANDTEPDGQAFSNVTVVSQPTYGTAVVSGLNVTYTHDGSPNLNDSFTYTVSDGSNVSNVATVSIVIDDTAPPPSDGHTVGLVNPNTGQWHLRADSGAVTSFFYGNPGDIPVIGDWDGDGVETVGMYRQSNGFVYLRNSNNTGVGEIQFTLGIAGDIPLAGDFNGDGKDTISVYRPSQGRVFIANTLGANNGFFVADYDYYFGDPGDKPFVGDFNADGKETVGLYRDTTGFVYFTDAVTPGNVAPTNNQFFYGNPSDRLVSGDWTGDGTYTMGIFRPSDQRFYLRYTNTQGNADEQFDFGQSSWLPVAGDMGL
ncbi:MAG: hypothetical protein KJO36_07150 [Acidimicrobiia bacterium]|nr:hypothetical protein [Acidimicrobiia bacterium]